MGNNKNSSVLMAVVISATIIVCVAIAAYAYIKANRYEVEHGRVYDKYENTYTSPDYKE